MTLIETLRAKLVEAKKPANHGPCVLGSTQINTERMQADYIAKIESQIQELTEPEIIVTCREIVREHQYQEIDGTIVDVITANMITKVYDALNEKNRAHFGALSLTGMVALGWKCIK